MKNTVFPAMLLAAAAVCIGVSASDAYVICDTQRFTGFGGIASGWELDGRAFPKSAVGQGYRYLYDTDKTLSSSLYRDFQTVSSGTLSVDGGVRFVSGFDGMTFALTNENGDAAYLLETRNGAFAVRQPDGTYRTLFSPASKTAPFDIRVTADLDAGTVSTVIGGKNYGSDALLGSEISRFGYTTTRAGILTAEPLRTAIRANYDLYETFDACADASVPFGFVSSDVNTAGASNAEGYCGGGGILRTDFEAQGSSIVELYVNAPKTGYGTLSVMGDHGTAFALNVVGSTFKLGDEVFYTYVSDMWYRLRFEADMENGIVLVKLNGRETGTYPMSEGTSKLTRIAFNFIGDAVRFDDLRVFPLVSHDDYVPEPVTPNGTEKYLVGVNVCPLWNNDTHYGWGLITPYERPYLGYYDEGDPETADWEIKYMVEHGIDFQAVCWYPDETDRPLKKPEMSEHLHEGYMNAKYADRMKYCLIWECKNGGVPTNLDDAKKYFVPYIIENYFKDDRYLVVGNKPVLGFFAVGSLMNALTFGDKNASEAGDWKKVKPLLDYIESEAKKLGFDGVIFLSTDGSNKYLGYMGIDAGFAYGFGKEGASLQYNKDRNLENASDGSIYTIPTVSVGFNNIAWLGTKSQMMTVSDFASAQSWVKDTYLKTYPNPFGVKTVMLSNWNEYGEGTYIFPCENNGGFGYLDALREAYTDEEADSSLNVLPTASQLARITRKYPSDHIRIRQAGETVSEASAYTLYIDGEAQTLHAPVTAKDGVIYVPFDTDASVSEKLGIAWTFDGTTLTLTGAHDDERAVITGFETVNGYPMLPVKTVCEALGLTITTDGDSIKILSLYDQRIPLTVRVVSAEKAGSDLLVKGYVTHTPGEKRTVVAAAYDEDGRLITAKPTLPKEHTTFDILLGGASEAALVKLFVFDDTAHLSPVCEAAKALDPNDNIIDIGDFWK